MSNIDLAPGEGVWAPDKEQLRKEKSTRELLASVKHLPVQMIVLFQEASDMEAPSNNRERKRLHKVLEHMNVASKKNPKHAKIFQPLITKLEKFVEKDEEK